MGLLDGYSLGGLLASNPAYAPTPPENRMLGVADYSGVQPGYAQPGPQNAGPVYDAATAFWDGLKGAPGAGVQHYYDVMGQPNPLTGGNAQWPGEISNFDKLATLLQTAGTTSLGGIAGGAEAGALGAGAARVIPGMDRTIPGWHASPHSFDRFDWWNHIGSGEGNAAYGQGGYIAGAEPTMEEYYRQFMRTHGAANRYQVNIHADPATLLDWHTPLNKQSDYVRGALKDAGLGGPLDHGASVYQQLSQWGRPGIDARGKGAAAASQYLNDAGIPGIKYLDGLSRSIGTGTLGKGTSNYVMFDPARIEILRKFGLLGGALGGGLLGGEQQQ